MFKRILTPLDGSMAAEQALACVVPLAKGLPAQLELVRVVEPLPPALTADQAQAGYQRQLAARLQEEAERYLDEVASRLAAEGMQVSTLVVQGDPASQIMAAAESPDVLIAMSTHGRSGLRHWALGSVCNKVLHATPNPLLLVRCRADAPDSREDLKAAVVPLDGSALAQQVLTSVTSLAKVLNLKADLVQVVPAVGGMPESFQILPAEGEGPGPEVSEQARGYLRQVAQELRQQGAPDVEAHVLQGHPAVAIIDYARGVPGSILIMASHGRSGIGRWRLGSITDLVARNSEGPVLIIPTAASDADT
jgi:nucleotide-binding universal stress UspA family protein